MTRPEARCEPGRITGRTRRGPVPVMVLAGFLGSGKTTLLNHLLRGTSGVRFGVVVNDFGAVGIDALLVAGQVDDAVDLGSGCVCCAVDVGELDAALARLTRGPAAVDAIVIEASGLAEPRSLIRMIVASTVPTVRYGGLVEVVDAEAFGRNRREHPELLTHIRMADLVVLNKTDLVTRSGLDGLRSELSGLASPAPVVDSTQGRIDPALVFDEGEPRAVTGPRQMTLDELLRDREPPRDGAGGPHHDGESDQSGPYGGHEHPHTRYSSVTYRCDGTLHPRRLVELLEDGPAGVYRMKGIVALADPEDCGTVELQTVGRYIYARRLPAARAATESTMVAIGAGLDEDGLRTAFDACRTDPHEPRDERALLTILKFCT